MCFVGRVCAATCYAAPGSVCAAMLEQCLHICMTHWDRWHCCSLKHPDCRPAMLVFCAKRPGGGSGHDLSRGILGAALVGESGGTPLHRYLQTNRQSKANTTLLWVENNPQRSNVPRKAMLSQYEQVSISLPRACSALWCYVQAILVRADWVKRGYRGGWFGFNARVYVCLVHLCWRIRTRLTVPKMGSSKENGTNKSQNAPGRPESLENATRGAKHAEIKKRRRFFATPNILKRKSRSCSMGCRSETPISLRDCFSD